MAEEKLELPTGITADMLVEVYEKIRNREKYGDTTPLKLTDEVVQIGEGQVFKIDKVDRSIPPTDKVYG